MVRRGSFGAALVGSVVSVLTFGGCSVRVGSDAHRNDPTGPDAATSGNGSTGAPDVRRDAGPDGAAPDASAPPPSGACALVGTEKRVALESGTDAFAWIWDGVRYVVAYADPAGRGGDVHTVFLDTDGNVLAPPTVVEATDAESTLPAIVATSRGYMVAWQEGSAGKAVYGRAIDENGNAYGRSVTIATTSAPESRPVVSRAPGGIAIAYMDEWLGAPTVQIAQFDAELNVVGPKQIASTATAASFPALAGDDHALAIAWSDARDGASDIRFASVGADLTTSKETTLRAGAPHDARLARIIKAGDGYLSAWEDMRSDDNQIYMAIVDRTGAVVAGGLVEEPGTGDANWPNMAFAGSMSAIAYYQWRAERPQVFVTFIDAAGRRLSGMPHDLQVSATTGTARFPDVAWNGRDFGVAWIDTRDGGPALYFARAACAP